MSKPIIKVHRGVCCNYPENTMAAYRAAADEGYTMMEIDPYFTADDVAVILHDRTINRTGRNLDGSMIKEEKFISAVSYGELSNYEFGSWFSEEFRGERIPTLEETLAFAAERGIDLEIDGRYQRFPEYQREILFRLIESSGASVTFVVSDLEGARRIRARMPQAKIQYEGMIHEPLTEELLIEFSRIVPREKLFVSLPYLSDKLTWLNYGYGFATKERAALVKKYATLSIWVLSEIEEYNTAVEWGADIILCDGNFLPNGEYRLGTKKITY